MVIPAAEKAKYEKPRDKFLFLAYDDIGECDLRMSKYAEAEAAFDKARTHADNWPTKEDSSYVALFVAIGMAREYQGNWKGGQEALENAMVLTLEYIEKRSAKLSDKLAMEEANHMRKSQDTVMELLAAAYFREGHKDEAFKMLDRAYDQATRYPAPESVRDDVVKMALDMAGESGDAAQIAKWKNRGK